MQNALRWPRPILRGLRDRRLLLSGNRASVAIEFALVAPIFLMVLLAIIDVGVLLCSQALLDTATTDAARLILTGQATSNGSAFANQLCNEVNALIPCSGLTYRVQTGDSFSQIPGSYMLGSDGAPSGFSSYPVSIATGNPGGSLTNDFVVVQAAYQRPWMVGFLGTISGHSTELLLSTVAFENEPTP
jgi:Flp pilus assembly protein TadG